MAEFSNTARHRSSLLRRASSARLRSTNCPTWLPMADSVASCSSSGLPHRAAEELHDAEGFAAE